MISVLDRLIIGVLSTEVAVGAAGCIRRGQHLPLNDESTLNRCLGLRNLFRCIANTSAESVAQGGKEMTRGLYLLIE